jgi:hypothetical protein
VAKQVTFGCSVQLVSSGQGEQSQIDFGPYVFANSPGQFGVTALANGGSLQGAGGANVTLPNYLCLLPLSAASALATTGPLVLKGPTTDVGVPLSASNPSFIPCTNVGGAPPTVNVSGNGATTINLAWI